jgi:Fe-S cluster assembly iron-binding protein IscA
MEPAGSPRGGAIRAFATPDIVRRARIPNTKGGITTMVHVTDRAIDKLAEMRQMGGLGPDQGIGIGVTQEGDLRFDLMKANANDEVIEKNGEPVMIIPQMLSQPLEATVLDYVDTPQERKFTLTEAGAGDEQPDASTADQSAPE